MTELNFFGKRHRQAASPLPIDISVTVGKTNVCVIFRRNALPVVKTNDYVKFAVADGRLYFDFSDDRDGYKIRKKDSATTSRAFVCGESGKMALKAFEGDWILRYDPETKHYFIGKESGVSEEVGE
ncbi:MAG: hypothetical protein IKD66_00740 [Solobacterium sp.]|nr:hypothetical protein [Solobacterium sp.]